MFFSEEATLVQLREFVLGTPQEGKVMGEKR